MIVLLSSGELENTLLQTLVRAGCGVLIGSAFGLTIGLAMGLKQPIYDAFSPLIGMLYSLPGIAMVPIFMIWMGLSDAMIITVSGIACFLNVAINTATGVKNVPEVIVNTAKVMGAGRLTLILKIYIPLSSKNVFTGLKLGIEHAWKLTIAAEMLIGAKGLGNSLMEAEGLLRLDLLFATVIVIGAIGWFFERIISLLERRYSSNVAQGI